MNYCRYKNNFITRLCYEFFDYSWIVKIKKPPRFLGCIKIFIHRLFHFIRYPDFREPCIKDLIFFSTSVNNNNALRPIWTKLKPQEYSVWECENIFSETKIAIYSFLHLPSFFRMYEQLPVEDRLVVREYNYWFMNVYGYYKVIDKFLKKNRNKIKLLVLANDHSPVNQCIIENCIKHNIKTMYVQHASIDEEFPPVRFTYSFLDGLDTYKKYASKKKVSGTAILSGSSRFDVLKKQLCVSEYIGIAINELDDFSKIFDLCEFLIDNGITDVILRPHPRLELQKEDMERFNNLGILFSDAKVENSFSFIAKLKLLISNESSIHLDALLMNIPSIQYNFSKDSFKDVYSFVKKGVVPFCENYEKVLKECISPHNVSPEIIKEWNAAYGTKYDGKVSDVIFNFIKNLRDGTEKEYIDSIFKFNTKGYYEYK